MIAALYVQKGGVYFGLPDVDPWDEQRDARLYAGPWPVVAHPPCARWGRFAVRAFGRVVGELGDDAGCFAAALASVRRWGGVLEHPASSNAWRHHGLFAPPTSGGWVRAGDLVGWTCHVEQGHYGHRMRKPTWLYVVGAQLADLRWGPSSPPGFKSHPGGSFGESTSSSLSAHQRSRTPIPFRDLSIAAQARPARAA